MTKTSLQIFLGLGIYKHNIHTEAHTDTHMHNIKIIKSKEEFLKTNKQDDLKIRTFTWPIKQLAEWWYHLKKV